MACSIDREECISCGACVDECPKDAISEKEENGNTYYEIDQLKCTCCVGDFDEPQCEKICPLENVITCDC